MLTHIEKANKQPQAMPVDFISLLVQNKGKQENLMAETVLWKGHPSYVVNLFMDIICIFSIFAILFFNIPIYFLIIPVLFAGYNFLTVRNTHYQLSTERLRTSKGILSKTIDELELYRVKDYRVEQPFMLRLFSLGHIILETSDKSHPTVIIRAVPNSLDLLDYIRTHVEERRSNKAIRELDINS